MLKLELSCQLVIAVKMAPSYGKKQRITVASQMCIKGTITTLQTLQFMNFNAIYVLKTRNTSYYYFELIHSPVILCELIQLMHRCIERL